MKDVSISTQPIPSTVMVLLTTRQCAQALNIHPQTLLDHIPSGTVKPRRDFFTIGTGKIRPTYRWDLEATRKALGVPLEKRA